MENYSLSAVRLRLTGTLLILSGILILWVGWGNAGDLLASTKVLCGVMDPRGLHLNSLGQVVYVNASCPAVVYDNAWLVFWTLSITGVTSLTGGLYLSVKRFRASD